MWNVRMMVKERDYIASLLVSKSRQSFKMPDTLPPIPEDDAEVLAAEEYYVEHANRIPGKQLKLLSLPLDKNLSKFGNSQSPSDESGSDESNICCDNEIDLSSTSAGDEIHSELNLIYHPRRRRRLRHRFSNTI